MEMVHMLNLNVMKKFRIIILAMVAAAALSSCQDSLDLRSNGTIDMSEVSRIATGPKATSTLATTT